MRRAVALAGVVLTGFVLGAVVSVLLMLPGVGALVGAGAVVILFVFLLWPWAVLPVGILGGATVGGVVGGGDVRVYVATHLVLLAAGVVALVVRRWLGVDPKGRRTVADVGMLALVGLTIVAAGYGLAVGNLPTEVLVAGYQIAILPLYFFLATHTLTTTRRLVAAGALYVVVATGLTAVSMTQPGRHGGLLTLLAIPPLVFIAGRVRGWRRVVAVSLAGFFAADVLLASYRGIWLAALVTIAVMLVFGGRAVRTGLAATAVAGLVVGGLLALQPGVQERAQEIGTGLQQSAGYRGPESGVGLDVFAQRPVLGAGLGQSTTDIYLADFAFTDVGPVYHAYYVTLLANVGLVGLALVLWPILRSVRAGLAARDSLSVPCAALCCGFLCAALFAAPTDGHWELGLLPALTLLTLPVRDPGPVVAAAIPAARRPEEVVWQ
ncbi:O-antigen ligase family protein [Micromonospora sp. NPDC000207]|uniref:O-antigen ligase family protein n=1 Tax=Micromonospora sp. NPDC000207 TaxID=3154246 RepID=UPI00331DF196